MRPAIRVADLQPEQIDPSSYDLIILSCGYEERSRYFAESAGEQLNVAEVMVLAFQEHADQLSRPENERFYRSLGHDLISISATNEDQLYRCLADSNLPPESRILVDYSSMPRLLYNAVLNWLIYSRGIRHGTMDFVYSSGQYLGEFGTSTGVRIAALPGCDLGYSARPERSRIAVFGLGFDAISTFSVYDRLEPDETVALIANPGARDEYPAKTMELNEEFIASSAHQLQVPLSSVQRSLIMIHEELDGRLVHDNVVMVPMGPKPLVLASILLSRLHPRNVICLQILGDRAPVNVRATGTTIGTRVTFARLGS